MKRVVGVAVLLLLSCPVGGDAPFPFEVSFARCAAVLRGPVCELGVDRTVLLWVGTTSADLDSSATIVRREPVGDGLSFELLVPEGAREVTLKARNTKPFRLQLRDAEPADAVTLATTLKQKGQLAEARRQLDAMTGLTPVALARRASLLARLALGEGDAEGAIRALAASMALHRQLGRPSDELNDGFALSWALVHHGRRFTEARQVLRGLQPAALLVPEGAAQLPYYEAIVFSETGDVRSALASLRVAEARATRLSMTAQRAAVDQLLTLQLDALGRHDEALARLARLALPDDACQAATLLTNRGWAALHAGRPAAEAASAFEAAIERFTTRCPRPADEANALTNLALARLLASDLEGAATALSKSREVSRDDWRLELWRLDLDARLAMARGKPGVAAALNERLETLAQASASPEAAWRGAVGAARAAEALGQPEVALRAYARAEAMLDDEYRRLPFGEGLHTLLAERESATGSAIELLVKQNRHAEALAVARHARTRVVRHLALTERVRALEAGPRERWERAVASYAASREALDRAAALDWQLAQQKLVAARLARASEHQVMLAALDDALAQVEPAPATLRAVAEGEVMLVVAPGRSGWLVFAATPQSVVARSLGALEPTASPMTLADALLGPFETELLGASSISFLPWGPWSALDLRTLPFKKGPLGASKPVVWRLDVPTREAAGGAGALLVADPSTSLPGARSEGAALTTLLPGPVTTLDGDAATTARVRAALPKAAVFHYAGHARQAGVAGFESELSLSDGRLTAADIVVLPSVPPFVVLSGCETGLGSPTGLEALGLAQAFVLAGASEVVATVKPLDDRKAALVMTRLHAMHREHDAAEALRSLFSTDSETNSAVQGYRVYRP